MRPEHKAPYSYRTDPDVPKFDDSGPIVFMDGDCALCSFSARMISRMDRKEEFRICPVQSSTGMAVLTHYGLEANNPETWLYLEDGCIYSSMDAVIRAGWRLGGFGYMAAALRLLPRTWRDGLYGVVARNRYRWFGKEEMCALPDPGLRKRLME